MSSNVDPLDLLAFMASGMSMTSEEIADRWPTWSRMKDTVLARYERESRAYRHKWGVRAHGTSDPMVDSVAAACHHWLYLPLIRAALEDHPTNFST